MGYLDRCMEELASKGVSSGNHSALTSEEVRNTCRWELSVKPMRYCGV